MRTWRLSIPLMALAAAVLAGCGGSESPAAVPSSPSGPAGSGRYVNPTAGSVLVYQIPGMDRADVTSDLVYSRADREDLLMDVYLPPDHDPSERLPAVLLGGPPAFDAGKDSGQKIGWGQLIAASGMAAVVFDIRSDNLQTTPWAPARDVEAAIEYVRSNADELFIDPSRLATLGFSIGTAPWHLWATMREPADYVRCNVVYYGPLDFQDESFLIDPSLVEEFSALTYLQAHPADIAPMFIAKAGRDQFEGINESIDRFVSEAGRLDADVRLAVHPEGDHGFDVQNDDETSRQIIRETLAFLETSLLS